MIIAGVLAALLGFWVMYQEAAPNVRGGATAIARVANMPDGEAPIGLTLLSQHRALLDCEQVLRSGQALEMQFLSVADQQRLIDVCRDMASDLTELNPSDSFAWLVLASAAASRGDTPGFNSALLQSQATGPNEGWIASLRVTASERNYAMLSAEALSRHNEDIELVAGGPYAPSVARLYISSVQFRTRMDELLKRMAPVHQRTFLDAVRSVLSKSGR
nr:hypothetical protein [uncultured Devosia sp.]